MLESLSANHYRVRGDINMQESAVLLQEMLALPKSLAANELHLDVSELASADSLLLAALLDLQRQLQAKNKMLKVSGLSAGISGLAHVYGIDVLLEQIQESHHDD